MLYRDDTSLLRMNFRELEHDNYLLKKALRDALDFALETANRAGGFDGGDSLNSFIGFLEETAARGLNLNETYRRLLDD